MVNNIEWKRARRNSTGSRVWPSKCGAYLVASCEIVFGVPISPVVFTAWAYGRKISTHRKRRAAERACAVHATKLNRKGITA